MEHVLAREGSRSGTVTRAQGSDDRAVLVVVPLIERVGLGASGRPDGVP